MKKCYLFLSFFAFLLFNPLGAMARPPAAMLVTDGQAIDITSPRYRGLFKELRFSHGFTRDELHRLFAGVTIKRRVLELMDRQWESQPYYKYFPLFINRQVIDKGKQKLKQHAALLEKIEQKFGVKREIVVAIWGIETRYGEEKGGYGVFQTLNTLFDAYPRRREFFRKQLIDFLLLTKANGIDPLGVSGSYAGAFGQTQFIPSSFLAYAVDFDGNGRRNVMSSVPDVLASIANYLEKFGWTRGEPIYWEIGPELKDARLKEAYKRGRKGKVPWQLVKKAQRVKMPAASGKVTVIGLEKADGSMRYVAGYPNFQAITAWNHSNRYSMAVAELAEKIGGEKARQKAQGSSDKVAKGRGTSGKR
jgi:membrane-bound lytic murein transglycosylase B